LRFATVSFAEGAYSSIQSFQEMAWHGALTHFISLPCVKGGGAV